MKFAKCVRCYEIRSQSCVYSLPSVCFDASMCLVEYYLFIMLLLIEKLLLKNDKILWVLKANMNNRVV